MWTYNDVLLSGHILLFASSSIATKYLDWTNSGGKDLYNLSTLLMYAFGKLGFL